jgi:hypothetical protein
MVKRFYNEKRGYGVSAADLTTETQRKHGVHRALIFNIDLSSHICFLIRSINDFFLCALCAFSVSQWLNFNHTNRHRA